MSNKNYNPAWAIAKWLSKYLPAGDWGLGFILPFFFALPLFIFLQVKNPGNFSFSLFASGGLYFVLTGWMIFSNVYGKRLHKTVLYSKRLSPLTEMGFEIENLGNYWGYKGVYKNYFFRIYYNWNTRLKRQVDFREITIHLSFLPSQSGKKIDAEKIIQLNKKYKNIWWKANIYEINFGQSFMEFHYPFSVFTGFQSIKTSIDEVLRIANEENLIPITEKELNKLIEVNALAHGPGIVTFQEAKNIVQ